nr:ribonuclease H-like domain-containing protein [Tanacetum cinerariifolium]
MVGYANLVPHVQLYADRKCDSMVTESIDSYDDLKKAFLENYLQQKKYIKDHIELHNIKQRDGESTERFMKRYKLESRDMRIELYFLMTDYSLWRLAKKNELKARGTLLMALPDKHQLKFNIHKDSKSLMEAIKKRLQKLISQLEILDLEDQSLDDLFNNLKIYEAEVKSSSSTSPTTQNIAFVSSQNTDITNKSVSAVTSVSAVSTKVPVFALPNEMDLKWQMAMLTMRAKSHKIGHFARECRSPKDTRNKDTKRRNVPVETCTSNALVSQCDDVGSYDWSFQADEEPTNYALMAFTSSSSSSSDNEVAPCLESVEARLVVYQQNENIFEDDIKLLKLDVMLRGNALVDHRKKFEKAEQEKDDLGYDNQVFHSTVFDCYELISFESDVSLPTSPVHYRYKSREWYHAVPPHYIGKFMPPKPDLVFHDAPTTNETIHTVLNVKPSTTKPSKDLSQLNRIFAPIIEDWVFDLEDESEGRPMPTEKAPSFVQTSEHRKTPRLYVKPVKHLILAKNRKKDIPKSRGHRHSWNRKAYFVCKSLTHLIKDYDYYKNKMFQKPVNNHAMRGNHHHYARMTHPYPYRHVIPTTVLTRSRLVPLTVAKPIITVVAQTKVQHQRPVNHGVHKANSPIRRPINLRSSPKIVIFIKKLLLLTITRLMLFKVSKETRINRGYVSFGGNPKCGKISGKGKIRTGKLDIVDVYFVKELKLNLFSVSQMCDKKNSVLFTDSECIVLSFNFKLPDENHVLLRVPRENNMYNVDLKNIVPSRNLTCFFAKATLVESNLRHRRLCHINFKTMNKMVKGNQPNSRTCIQENLNAGTIGKEAKSVQQYVFLPLWSFDSKDPHNIDDGAFEVKEPEFAVHVSPRSCDKIKKHVDKTKREAKGKSPVELST